MFKGLLREVTDSYIKKEDNKATESLELFRRKMRSKKSQEQNENLDSNIFSSEQDNYTVINSIGTDGTILQVKVAQRITRL